MSSLALLIVGVIGYNILDKDPPSFRRGGQFAIAGPPSSTTSPTSATADTTATSIAAAVPGATAPPVASSTTATTARRSGGGAATPGSAATTPSTRAGSGPAATTPTTLAKPAPQPGAPSGPGKPALGTYTWKVDGTEGASFVGTRRFPETMTMVVHAGASVKPDQLVFDLTYSDKHAEREIVGFRADGIYFDFEGGSVTFGPRTETSQADYEPPILEIPFPLQPGLSRSGVTKAKGANGAVSRTEDWKATVIGQEALTIAGATVNTWKVQVDRKIRPGTADQGFRNRTMWFDPARNMWVKFVETFHGERTQGPFSFSYDSNATAVLTGFTP